MGLLSGALSGLGDAAQGIAQGWIRNEQELDLAKEREKIALSREAAVLNLRDAYQQKAEARSRQQFIDDNNRVSGIADANLASSAMAGLGEAGAGAKLRPEDVQALRDNPQAVEAYRQAGAKGLLDATPAQVASARSSAAMATGNTTLADRYMQQESVAKSDQKYKDSLDKITRDEIRQAARDKVSDEEKAADNKRLDRQLDAQISQNRIMQGARNDARLTAKEEREARAKLNQLLAQRTATMQLPDSEGKTTILNDNEIKLASLGRVLEKAKPEMQEVTTKQQTIDDENNITETTTKKKVPVSAPKVVDYGVTFLQPENSADSLELKAALAKAAGDPKSIAAIKKIARNDGVIK